MSPALDQELADLSPGDRLALIGELWDSLDGVELPLTTAQATELDRRLETRDEERLHAVPCATVRADLSARPRA